MSAAPDEEERCTLGDVAKTRAPSHRAKRSPARRWSSWWELLGAAVAAARAELRAMSGTDPEILSDRWFELWEAKNGPTAFRDEPAHAHVRAIHDALAGALEYRAGLGTTWDALEGADRQLHEALEDVQATALTARPFGRGGFKLRRAPMRADLVDMALRQFESFTVREVALLSLAAGFAPPPPKAWHDSRHDDSVREPTAADVIALEAETIRLEMKRQISGSNWAKARSAKALRQGRAGRPKTPT